MAPPLGFKKVMAIDPGFRTGCKLVCLDPQGKLVHNETIYPHSGAQGAAKASERIRSLAAAFATEAIAIGNGTAGRETESFIRSLGLSEEIQVVMVDESGASIYSASSVAREEFPDHELTSGGGVIGDGLSILLRNRSNRSESIAVGLYRTTSTKSNCRGAGRCGDELCEYVGVEINSASPQLVAYVSGSGLNCKIHRW